MLTTARDQREYQLTGMMLENRRNLHAEYAIVMDRRSPASLTDREMIRDLLRTEFPPTEALHHNFR